MGKADLHIHSSFSDSTSTISAILDWSTSTTDLNVIAITDHDTVEGALLARSRAEDYGIEVIPGAEITTSEGHLLALFIEQSIPAHRPMLESIRRVADLGGLCIMAHPMAIGVHGASAQTIRRMLENPIAVQTLIGLESINACLLFQKSNLLTKALAEELNLGQTGGSDSHLFWTIGSGYTEFPGTTAPELRRALVDHTTLACREDFRRSPGYFAAHAIHLGMRMMGWSISPQPNAGRLIQRINEAQI